MHPTCDVAQGNIPYIPCYKYGSLCFREDGVALQYSFEDPACCSPAPCIDVCHRVAACSSEQALTPGLWGLRTENSKLTNSTSYSRRACARDEGRLSAGRFECGESHSSHRHRSRRSFQLLFDVPRGRTSWIARRAASRQNIVETSRRLREGDISPRLAVTVVRPRLSPADERSRSSVRH